MIKMFRIYRQFPDRQKAKDEKVTVLGELTVIDKLAIMFEPDGGSEICRILHPEIVHASSSGIFLKGMEVSGFDRKGRLRYNYQEWWLKYENKDIQKGN